MFGLFSCSLLSWNWMVFTKLYEASKWKYVTWVARVLEFSCVDSKLSLDSCLFSFICFHVDFSMIWFLFRRVVGRKWGFFYDVSWLITKKLESLFLLFHAISYQESCLLFEVLTIYLMEMAGDLCWRDQGGSCFVSCSCTFLNSIWWRL